MSRRRVVTGQAGEAAYRAHFDGEPTPEEIEALEAITREVAKKLADLPPPIRPSNPMAYVAYPQSPDKNGPRPSKCGNCMRGNIWQDRQSCPICGAINVVASYIRGTP